MSWKVKANPGAGGGVIEKAPAGNHVAVLVALIDLGQQWQDGYQGETGRYQHRVYFVWELVNEPMSGFKDRNHVMAVDLTMSMNEKAKMRKWLEARRGEKFKDDADLDISEELGKPCLLNVVLNQNGYPRIEGISQLAKGMPVPTAKHPLTAWKMGDNIADIPAWVPWLYGRSITEVIQGSPDYKATSGDTAQSQPSQQPQPPKPSTAMKTSAPGKPPVPGANNKGYSAVGDYFVYDPQQGEYVRMKGAQIVEMYAEKDDLVWPDVYLYPASQEANPNPKPAADYGFPAPGQVIPF